MTQTLERSFILAIMCHKSRLKCQLPFTNQPVQVGNMTQTGLEAE